MTSRPVLGVQQRQPSRKPSKPSHSRPAQRTLSQLVLPSPRKDANQDGQEAEGDAVQALKNGTPRRAGSRLRLELTHDMPDPIVHTALSESPHTLESSKPMTPRLTAPVAVDLPMSSNASLPVTGDVPLPMPKRRARISIVPPPPRIPPVVTAKKDVRPKPWHVNVPVAAPRYNRLGKGESGKAGVAAFSSQGSVGPAVAYADFFPWTGKHPEDQLSENVIRQGYFDKASVAQSETSSAKTQVFPKIKQVHGLSNLSAIFVSILGERRLKGSITAPSTFKPPPRVTLTDAKREPWLRDLANSAVPLRRLSRTIPHGIRGKVLLEQCLNKYVPADRAVWLAKCVGANEIRASKRKGLGSTLSLGGEAKWIRDWTISVEQFVDGLVAAVDTEAWRDRLDYALRLATHLYDEHLLDREHYREWLVSGLENSNQAKLPIWILLIQIYWKDVLKLRRYGRRLTTALLSHLYLIQGHVDSDILVPLSSKLQTLVSKLVLDCPENFVMGGPWSQYRDTAQSCLRSDDARHQKALAAISSRNEQVMVTGRARPDARYTLVKMLDGTLHTCMADDFSQQCWKMMSDKSGLINALLEWCTSLYRPGQAKIYVCCRILRDWATLGLDLTIPILDFAQGLAEAARNGALHQVVGELVRSGHFSVLQYCQWLITHGGLTEEDVESEGPAASRLLVELPVHVLTEREKIIRAGILGRASFDVEDEETDRRMAIQSIGHALGITRKDARPQRRLPMHKLARRLGRSSRALQTGVGSWLHDMLVNLPDEDCQDGGRDGGRPAMSPATFNAVRTILEAGQDFSMLAEVLASLAARAGVEVLASIADTVNRHLTLFAALGSAHALFHLLYERLQFLVGKQGIGARPLLASLASLAAAMPDLAELGRKLERELQQSDRNNPLDACSPISDSMTGGQEDGADVHDELDKLLTSGTSLDRKTMDRLFQTVVQRLQISWHDGNEKQRIYSALLARLRIFDATHFNKLMTKWLLHLRAYPNRPSLSRLLPLLVSIGCLSLSTILASCEAATAGKTGQESVQSTYQTRYMQQALELFMTPPSPDGLLTVEESYRFSILQERAQREKAKEVLSLIRLALAEYSLSRSQTDVESLPLDGTDAQDQLLALLRILVLKDAGGVAKALAVKGLDPQVSAWMERLTTKLLMPTRPDETHVSFDHVLELADDFTLPFCQVKLSQSLGSGESHESAARQQSHMDLFAKAMDRAIDERNMNWTGMLPILSAEITHHLKSQAQARFLALLPSVREPGEEGSGPSVQMAEKLVSVMDAIIRGGCMGRAPQLVPAMVDKLFDLWELLTVAQDEATSAVLDHWLPLLLTFIILHTQTFDTSKQSNEVRARAVIICAALVKEIDDKPGRQALAEHIFDMACLLADNLAEEARKACARALRESCGGDWRICYLLSFQPNPSERLMLSMRDKASGGPGVAGLLSTPTILWGMADVRAERLAPFHLRRWEILSEPTPNVGENDTALSLALFGARKVP